MEILTAYVRENARWQEDQLTQLPPDGDVESVEWFANWNALPRPDKPRTDIRAVLSVLSRRNRQGEEKETSLDLSRTNLQSVGLNGEHLEQVSLEYAHLEWAVANDAHFEGTNFFEAHLESAMFVRCHMEGANFIQAHLDGAMFPGCHLEGANFEGAHGLILNQIKRAYIDVATTLPPYLSVDWEEWKEVSEQANDGSAPV
jgi:hypothetical protein